MNIRVSVRDGAKEYDIDHPGSVLTVGRNPAGDLVLEEDAAESVVSWDHARIDLSAREATLTDLRSTNGTYRNNAPVNGTVPLWPNDSIRFGKSGPELTVLAIDLTPAVVPAAPVPPPLPATRPARAKRPPITVSSAVVELQDTREELRNQQAAHARHQQVLAGVGIATLVCFLLLAAGLLRHSGTLNQLGARTDKIEDGVSALGEQMRQQADDTATHFGKIEKDRESQKVVDDERTKKIEAVAQQVIAQEAAVRGGIDTLKKEFGASVDDLNHRIADKPAPLPPVPQVTAVASTAPAKRPGPRIEPGMKMDVIMKQNLNTIYTGVLLGISGTEVRLQTLALAGAKPTVLDLRKIQAFETLDGMFALNEKSGEFEPAVTYFRFNKATKEFERTESGSQTPVLAEDAQVLGPTTTVRALWARGPSGEWCVGLPLAMSQSPGAIPAYHFKEIITAKGVYTFNESTQDFIYKAHSQLAAEAKEKRDEYWRQVDEKEWQRRKEAYQLATERFTGLASYAGRSWWWW
jgi:hypothetical protein